MRGAAEPDRGANAGGLAQHTLQHDRPSGRAALFTGRNAAFGVAALLVLVIISPFLRQSLEMSDAQSRLDGLAPRMALVDQLHHRIAGAGAGGEAVVAETRRWATCWAGWRR